MTAVVAPPPRNPLQGWDRVHFEGARGVAKVNVSDAVRLQRGVDFTKLPLGAQDGFILSRVEGRTAVKDIVASTGLGQEAVVEALQKLVDLGVLTSEVVSLQEEPDEGMPMELPPELRVEKVDLMPEQRLRILQMEYICARRSYYEVLGQKRTVAQGELKRAFHETSREFHPDAFFRKELGSFKPRLERVFKTIKKAYDVLGDEPQRQEYDKNLPPDRPPPKKAEPTPAWRLDPRRQQEAEDRRLKRNPLVQRVERARRHLTRAKEFMAAKQYALAANEAGLAAAQDPWNEEVKTLHEKVQGEIREEKFARTVARIELLCANSGMGAATGMDPEEELAQLVAAVKDAMEGASVHGVLYLRMGRALLKAGHPKLAKAPADRALRLLPEDERAIMLTVDLLEQAGLHQSAYRMLEKAAQLAPSPEKDERLKKLRKAMDR